MKDRSRLGLNNPEIKTYVEQYHELPVEHREEALWATIAKIAGKMDRKSELLHSVALDVTKTAAPTPLRDFANLSLYRLLDCLVIIAPSLMCAVEPLLRRSLSQRSYKLNAMLSRK
ncbi:hypothetical protein KIN20_032576 [Parelaphostrongylus tenuis]|uniref:Uncharacterized protein n=1 Tax=Parelaphostrongylus tenuis TaxID=148309 RepID=A0AAD5R918_PARTN|nr:hypothetical protein KIN20_032576 [Parelaphostrongylus tenuis]